MKVIYYTSKGKVRDNNEDAILIQDKLISEADFEEPIEEECEGCFLFAVADGMGGHQKGEIASREALETLRRLKPRDNEELDMAIEKSRDRLEELVKQDSSCYGMGTAIAGLILKEEGYAVVFNVGDCRVYRIRENKIERLTIDHSLVEMLVARGDISREEAKQHPKRNVLTSAIIGDNYKSPLEVYKREVIILENTKFLICSDGLWEELEEEELLRLANSETKSEFFDILKDKPLKDNLSFILLEVVV